MSKPQLYADLPLGLHEADALLASYGRWANRRGGPGRCGSAEGMYRSPQNDEDRQPKEPQMQALDAERCQRALCTLPMMTLLVIQWLYVDASGLQAKMRKNNIQPRHMRERHLQGVRLFWDAWIRLAPTQQNTVAFPKSVLDNCVT